MFRYLCLIFSPMFLLKAHKKYFYGSICSKYFRPIFNRCLEFLFLLKETKNGLCWNKLISNQTHKLMHHLPPDSLQNNKKVPKRERKFQRPNWGCQMREGYQKQEPLVQNRLINGEDRLNNIKFRKGVETKKGGRVRKEMDFLNSRCDLARLMIA